MDMLQLSLWAAACFMTAACFLAGADPIGIRVLRPWCCCAHGDEAGMCSELQAIATNSSASCFCEDAVCGFGLTWCILLFWVQHVVCLQQLQAAVAAGLLLCCCTDGRRQLGRVCHDSPVNVHKAAVLLQHHMHQRPAAVIAPC